MVVFSVQDAKHYKGRTRDKSIPVSFFKKKKRLLLIPAKASINLTHNSRKQNRFLEQITNKPKTLQKVVTTLVMK